jgi:hypothetical protein
MFAAAMALGLGSIGVQGQSSNLLDTGPHVTDAQRVEMWQPFSATAGTYEVRGNEFTIRPIVAKNPGFMAGSGFFTFELAREGNDVWIRASQDASGPIPRANANRVKLVRLE